MDTTIVQEVTISGHKFRVVLRSNEDGFTLHEFNHFGSVFIPYRDLAELETMLAAVRQRQVRDTAPV